MEKFEWLEECRLARLTEQKLKKDYNDNHEKCNDCGTFLNSHDHCPTCDY